MPGSINMQCLTSLVVPCTLLQLFISLSFGWLFLQTRLASVKKASGRSVHHRLPVDFPLSATHPLGVLSTVACTC